VRITVGVKDGEKRRLIVAIRDGGNPSIVTLSVQDNCHMSLIVALDVTET
jgi:hypothetical protein